MADESERIKDILATASSLGAGEYIPIDGPEGTKKLDKDGLMNSMDLIYPSGKNKFNKDTIITGKFINTSTAIIYSTDNCAISDFIPVKSGEVYVLSGIRDIDYSINKYMNWIGLYGADKNPISSSPTIMTNEHLPFTIPAGCYYIIIQLSYSEASPNFDLVQLERGMVVTDYESYALEPFAAGFRDKINSIEYIYKPGKNLITPQGFNHRYIVSSDGSITTGDSTKQMTSFIEIDPIKVYTFRGKIANIPYGWNFWGSYYDESFSLITKTELGLDGLSEKFSQSGFESFYCYRLLPPTNAKYLVLVICYDGDTIDLETLQLEEGPDTTLFEAYNSTRILNQVNSSAIPEAIFIPQANGKKVVFLGDSISYLNAWQPYLVQKLGIIYDVVELRSGKSGHAQTGFGGSAITPIVIDSDGKRTGNSIYMRADSVQYYSADIIFLFGGQNDVGEFENAQQTLGTTSDAPYTGGEVTYTGPRVAVPTFCSALKGTLKKLIEQNPTAKIIVITPYQCGGIARTDGSFVNKENYVAAILDIAKQYSCQTIDLCHESGITIENNSEMTFDGVHPSSMGAQKIAELIISKI